MASNNNKKSFVSLSETPCLFDRKTIYLSEHTKNGRYVGLSGMSTHQKRKIIYENMHLMEGMTFTSNHQFPQMEPYYGSIDFNCVSYVDRNKHSGKNEALHFFLDDYRFRDAVWCNLEKTTYSIGNFDYYFTPDLSLWMDLPTDFYNRENVFRTRFVGAYWQKCGYNVIPTASWGGLNSFTYCFEGLPAHSVIAVSGMGNSRNKRSFNHWCNGLRRLEAAKAPTLIFVYGEEVSVKDLKTPLKFLPCFINEKLRKL